MSRRIIKCNIMRIMHIMSKWRTCETHETSEATSLAMTKFEHEHTHTHMLIANTSPKMLIVRLILHLRRGIILFIGKLTPPPNFSNLNLLIACVGVVTLKAR